MTRGVPTPPQTIAEARRLYEETDLCKTDIAVLTGVHRATLRRYVVERGWRRHGASGAPPRQRQAVVAALRERVEREIVAAESVMSPAGKLKVEGVERISRSLAMLVRTLRELGKYDEEEAARAGRAPGAGEEADDGIADLDAFRDALADRLEKLRLERGA